MPLELNALFKAYQGNRLAYLQAHIDHENLPTPSPFGGWLAGIIKKAERGSVTLCYTPRPEWLNPANILHGGLLAGIADDIMGLAVATLDTPHFYSTLNLTTNFLSPAKATDLLFADADVVKEGKQILHVSCRLYTTDGRTILLGDSNLITVITN